MGGGPGRGFRVRKPRGAVSTTSGSMRRFVGEMAAGARSRARARAGGTSPDEMSGRYGEVVRRTHACFRYQFADSGVSPRIRWGFGRSLSYPKGASILIFSQGWCEVA
jgi:hypothetical protein